MSVEKTSIEYLLYTREQYTLIKQITFLFLLLFYSLSALSLDGNSLLNYCQAAIQMEYNQYSNLDKRRESDNFMAAGMCYGYLYSAVDYNTYNYLLMLATKKENRLVYCTKNSNISYSQIAKIIVKYLQDHPKDLNLPANVLIMTAMSEAYPCSQNTSISAKP